MKSKFDMLFEANFTRYQGGGYLTGDVIKLKEGWANDDWCKTAPAQVIETLKQLDESARPIHAATSRIAGPERIQ